MGTHQHKEDPYERTWRDFVFWLAGGLRIPLHQAEEITAQMNLNGYDKANMDAILTDYTAYSENLEMIKNDFLEKSLKTIALTKENAA